MEEMIKRIRRREGVWKGGRERIEFLKMGETREEEEEEEDVCVGKKGRGR